MLHIGLIRRYEKITDSKVDSFFCSMSFIRIISWVRRERRGMGAKVFLTKLGYSGLMKFERILMKEFLDTSMFGTFLCMSFKIIIILSTFFLLALQPIVGLYFAAL
jgi:hypothetical protein